MKERSVLGWREWIGLPELAIPAIKVKVDTGARSSSLHAHEIEYHQRRGKTYVSFKVHPRQKDARLIVPCRALLHDVRPVKSSIGKVQKRPVIRTSIAIGGDQWDIDVTLTSRDEMGFRMLLGREAIRGRFVVDPGRSFFFGDLRNERRKRGKRK